MVTVMETLLATLLRILEFVIALGVLIFLHELGHFTFARLFKIEVEEFGFGFPAAHAASLPTRRDRIYVELDPLRRFRAPQRGE